MNIEILSKGAFESAMVHLEPGEQFRYTSAAILETPVGSMHGGYEFERDDGERFLAPIAAFSLSVPNLVH